MSGQHKAVFLDEKGKPFRVGSIETKPPAAGEVQIRAKALAINPVDWKIQDYGIFLTGYPAILGEDVAGEVVAVGEGVARFKTGYRVLAHSSYLDNNTRLELAAFQELTIVPESNVVRIPDAMSYVQASVVPLAISTAAAGLYMRKSHTCLELDLPSTSPKDSGKTLLVWGGSSSVGTATIQLAVASGLTVATTCSARNFAMVEKLGAKAFDYSSPGIVGDLVAELKKGEFVGAFDAIGGQESGMQCVQILAQFGGGTLASTLWPPKDLPATVEAAMVEALNIFEGDSAFVGKAIYEDFLPKALASGQFVPTPPAEVVGQGLQAIQQACQKHKAGVSAKKLLVTL